MNILTVCIVAVSLFAYALLVATIPLRKTKMLQKAGPQELPVKPRVLKFAVVRADMLSAAHSARSAQGYGNVRELHYVRYWSAWN